MFWRCERCALDYDYPVGRCMSCLEPLKDMVPLSFKLLHSIEVRIPSEGNPRVPYFVNILEDEHGKQHFRKSFIPLTGFQELPGESAAARVRHSLHEAVERVMRLSGFKGRDAEIEQAGEHGKDIAAAVLPFLGGQGPKAKIAIIRYGEACVPAADIYLIDARDRGYLIMSRDSRIDGLVGEDREVMKENGIQ